jgi:prepilin-type N-terminal cleavage/methylation domain-containing protein
VSNLLKKEKGFTLIEIVLVLAIAGLLLVIVFLAVAGAQKSRRDTQRKNDLSRVAANLETYAGNQNGNYPTNAQFAALFQPTGQYYLGANTVDPLSGTAYTFQGSAANPVAVTTGPAQVNYNLQTPRVYNVCIGLEQGTFTCRTNN